MSDTPLRPDEARARLDALRAHADERRRREAEHARHCAGCERCLVTTPLGVPIDELFDALGLGGREGGGE